jgi:CRISPR/Cas system-associated endonuclease/helicase Cas3
MEICQSCGRPQAAHPAANHQAINPHVKTKGDTHMTLAQNNELVTLKAELADTKASLKKWQDSHHKWEAYAHSLEVHVQTHAQQQHDVPEFDWEPVPGQPGFNWNSEGVHDMEKYRQWVAERKRVAEEIRQQQDTRRRILEMVANSGEKFEWDPAPGDPNFDWGRGKKEAA